MSSYAPPAIFTGMTRQQGQQRPVTTQPVQPPTPVSTPAPAPTGTPALGNIYDYFVNKTGTQDPLSTANTSEMSDADFYAGLLARQGDGFEYTGSGDRGANFGIRQGGFLDTLNQKYNGAATYDPNTRQMQWDFSKLPQTKFGSVENTIRVTPEMEKDLMNRGLVYDDPVYGRITHKGNYDSGNGWMGQLLMTLVSMGMPMAAGAAGGAMGANSMRNAMSVIRAIQSGARGNPIGAIANLGMQYAGVPTWARSAGNMAIGQMVNNARGGRG